MKQTLNVLKVLAEESRLRIFMALQGRELCVCQLILLLGLAPSTTSKHLALMYQAGIIEQRKDGRWAYYCISSQWKKQNEFSQWLLANLDDSERIANDRARLAEILLMPLDEICGVAVSKK